MAIKTDVFPYRNGRAPSQPIYARPMTHLRELYFAHNGKRKLTREQCMVLANVERAPRPWVEQAIAAAQRGY